jgi:hypothetical protein
LSRNALILILTLFLSNCSVIRHSKTASSTINKGYLSIDSVVSGNLSNKDFAIKRIDIGFQNGSEHDEFLATLKFKYPDKWLISLRNKTGIEGARIFITGDSLFVNDRIHKKLLVSDLISFERKYGIAAGKIPVIFGDLILEEGKHPADIECVNGMATIKEGKEQTDIEFSVDCDCYKATKTRFIDNSGNILAISIKRFSNTRLGRFPAYILINTKSINAELKIKGNNYSIEKAGEIAFIPGKGYEKEILR